MPTPAPAPTPAPTTVSKSFLVSALLVFWLIVLALMCVVVIGAHFLLAPKEKEGTMVKTFL